MNLHDLDGEVIAAKLPAQAYSPESIKLLILGDDHKDCTVPTFSNKFQ